VGVKMVKFNLTLLDQIFRIIVIYFIVVIVISFIGVGFIVVDEQSYQ
jgi:hypothetical protein